MHATILISTVRCEFWLENEAVRMQQRQYFINIDFLQFQHTPLVSQDRHTAMTTKIPNIPSEQRFGSLNPSPSPFVPLATYFMCRRTVFNYVAERGDKLYSFAQWVSRIQMSLPALKATKSSFIYALNRCFWCLNSFVWSRCVRIIIVILQMNSTECEAGEITERNDTFKVRNTNK